MNQQITLLMEENKKLKHELDCLREGAVIESMNEMRDTYMELEKDVERLQERLNNSVSEIRYNILKKRNDILENIIISVQYLLTTIRHDIQNDSNLQMNSRTSYKIKIHQIESLIELFTNPRYNFLNLDSDI